MINAKHFLRFFFVVLIMITSYQANCYAQQEEEILAITSHQLGDVARLGRLRKKAVSENDAETLVKTLRTIAQIYINREYYLQAELYLNDAHEYIQQNDKCKAHLPFIYYSFAEINEKIAHYQKSLDYANKCIELSNHQRTTIQAQLLRALDLYYLKQYDEFEKAYADLQRDKTASKFLAGRLEVMHYIRRRDFRSAHSKCSAIMDKQAKLEMLVLTCQAEARYKDAMKYLHQLEEYNDNHMLEIRRRDLEETSEAIGLERREAENEKMKLRQKQLDIENQDLQREKGVAEEEAAKLKIHNNNLQVQKLKLKRGEVAENIKLKKQMMADQEKKEQHMRSMRNYSITVLLCLIACLGLFLAERYFTSKKIRLRNKQLEIARKLVEESDKTKTVFLQNVSHEIRTPLNAILGFSQILTCKDFPLEDEEKREYARLVKENSTQLTTLITDIFLLSDLDNGKVTISNGKYSCNQLCREAIADVKAKLQEGVNIVFKTDLDDDFLIETDGAHLKLILTNLLTNSEKYTNSGEIRLIASKAGNNDVEFAVEDTGTGIPKDKSEQVFERFEKLGSFIPGNGLGLSISRAIGKLMNLELKMDTAYEGGSRFTLKHLAAMLLLLFTCSFSFAQTEHEREYINEHEEIFRLLRKNDTTSVSAAMARAKNMRVKAQRENFPFGMLSAYRALSNIYLERLNYKEAIKVLDEADAYLERINAPATLYSVVYYEKARNYDYLNDAQLAHDFSKKAMATPFSVKTKILANNLFVRSLYKLKKYDEFLEEYEKLVNNADYNKYIIPGRAEIYYNIVKKNFAKAHEIARTKDSELALLETEIEIYTAEKKYKEALEASQRVQELKYNRHHFLNHGDLSEIFANFKTEVLRADSLSISNAASALELEKVRLALAKQQAETDREKAQLANSNLLIEKESLETQRQQLAQSSLEELSRAQAEENAHHTRVQSFALVSLVIVLLIISYVIYRTVKVRRQLRLQQVELQKQLEKAEESDRLKSAFMDNLNVNLSDQLLEVNSASEQLFSVPEPPEEKRFSLANSVFNAASDMMKVLNDVLNFSQKAALQEFANKDINVGVR